MLRITDRHAEYAFEAGMAHAMGAGEFGGFGNWNIRKTSKTLNPADYISRLNQGIGSQ